ncbi:MAG: SMI1/KNR4 family protein [Pirellulales bacterium]|nr:SMI1/KNR4 family protein [Pirellulales bacterium]
MILDDIQPTSAARYHNNPLDVDLVEFALGTRFPTGYRDFITRFGAGILGGRLRIYPPRKVLHNDDAVLELVEQSEKPWFWQPGAGLLTTVRGVETVVIADSVASDAILFSRWSPERLFVLHHDGAVYATTDGFLSALEWALTSGPLMAAGRELIFEPRSEF